MDSKTTIQSEHRLIPDAPYSSYDDYLQQTGPSAVLKARGLSPSDLLEEIQSSRLRGRGGAGFPVGTKWRTLRNHPSSTRFVVCNAAEGEPGTFKDRWLIRKNPYALIEGMLIAAHVIETQSLYVGIKRSFVEEVARLRAAVSEMSEAGLLEPCQIHIVEGPDEYLFGEEKALLEVLSGNEPLPREAHYPPYERGLFFTPTSPNPALVNNAETYAHVPSIVRAGAASFRKLGTHDTPGTVIFTISGDVQRPGIYELEAGISLRTLFHEVAGGPRDGRTFKAALSGVSSGVIPAHKFDTPADFASLQLVGAGLGSAGFMVFDDQASMPRVAQAVARFLYVESCNQCSACKYGLRKASTAIDTLFEEEEASGDELSRALYGARGAPQGNRCYLPVQGSIIIPSLLKHFESEFEDQLTTRPNPSDERVIPKFADFDEATRTFTIDPHQALKNPDWSYRELTPAEAAPSEIAAPVKSAPLTVQIGGELLRELDRAAEIRGEPRDAIVDEALRAWLAAR